jgi:hypothetical protein
MLGRTLLDYELFIYALQDDYPSIRTATLTVIRQQDLGRERDTMTDNEAETKSTILGLERADWWFWAKWILGTLVGGSVGLAVGGGLTFLVMNAVVGDSNIPTAAFVMALTIGIVAGIGAIIGTVAGIGTAQWMVLRERVHRAGWWVLATAVGGVVGLAAGGFAGWLVVVGLGGVESGFAGVIRVLTPALIVGMAVGGAVVGTAQWMVLRKRVRRAGWWVLASAVGMGASGVVSVVGVGVITGFVLIMLLRHPKTMPPKEV